MIDIYHWVKLYLQEVEKLFTDRIWFVGLQGSYGRGEATEKSDIDMVLILDTLSYDDIRKYNDMLDRLPHRDLTCGFLSCKQDITHWDAADLFQLYHDTTPIRGSMNDLLPLLDQTAVARAIKIGACNIYHMCVHNMLYSKKDGTLAGLYKSASFVVQAIAFAETGIYHRHLKDLLGAVSPADRRILETFIALKQGEVVCFEEMSASLFAWAQKTITEDIQEFA